MIKKDPLEEVTLGTGSTSKDAAVVGKGKIQGAAEPSQVRRVESKRLYEQVWLMCNQGMRPAYGGMQIGRDSS